ncbi:MAG: hypothetical protein V1837_06795 [Candidatus Woesearchaeota archaeon]
MRERKAIIASPLTTNFSLVGTAFDYLLRFYVQKNNVKTISNEWISTKLLNFTKYMGSTGKEIRSMLKQAKINYKEYLKKDISDDLLRSCLLLAKIDNIQRSAGELPTSFLVDEKDMQDLKNLYYAIPDEVFKSDTCVLNPTFGPASIMLGGADADLIIGDTLVDIKTTVDFTFTKSYFLQLVGYYILNKIGKVEGNDKKIQVNNLGIYYSRYGYLFKFGVKEVIIGDVDKFIELFVDVAQGFK